MARNAFTHIVLFSLLGGLCGCGAMGNGLSANTGDGASRSIVLTDVDFDPESIIPENQPMADYLASRLKRKGIAEGGVQIAPDVETLMQWLQSGEVNLYFDSVYPAMQVIEATGAVPILRRWKDGVGDYSTYFVVRKDSDISSLTELEGRMMAMQSPTSSSGFMFPMLTMLDAGLTPVEKSEANHPVAEDEIGYLFSGQDENTANWILEGKVVAGAIDNETWEELSDAKREQLDIIAETDSYPRQLVVAGPSLTPEQMEAIKAVMVDMDESRQGREVLLAFKETAQFDEFPGGMEAEIARLKTAFDQLEAHLQSVKEENRE